MTHFSYSDRVDEMLAITAGDAVTVSFSQSSDPTRAFRGVVELTPRSCLLLRCPRACIEVVPPSGQTHINVVFHLDRGRFIAMHLAIQAASMDVLFPVPGYNSPSPISLHFFDENLVDEQKK